MSSDQRRYTDEEFARVLHTALRLQERTGTGTGAGQLTTGEGLTLEEMKAAARDAGIDPVLIDRAIATLPSVERSGGRATGSPVRYRLAWSSPRTATREELIRVVDAIREESGMAGQVTDELDGVSWETARGEPSQIHVSIFPTEEGTEVRLSVDRTAAAVLTHVFPISGGFFAGLATAGIMEPEAALTVIGILATGLTGGVALARGIWARNSARIRRQADRLMDAATRVLSGS